MQTNKTKKTGIVVLSAVAIVGVFVATALAAPVLQPGVTSAPGMSGVCTDCHTYATTPTTPTPPSTSTSPTAPPAAGNDKDRENDEGDKPVVKKATSHKRHHSKAHKARARERD